MENNTQTTNKKCNCTVENCGHDRWISSRRHRALIAVAGLILAFWAGHQFGEMKGMMRALYGGHMGHRGGHSTMMYTWGNDEMRGFTLPPTPPTTAVPATTPIAETAQ